MLSKTLFARRGQTLECKADGAESLADCMAVQATAHPNVIVDHIMID